ncbi:hypothetical protein [Frankia sp. Mgl5]|nr:hypothetical protein [Frankia sp. Mgl5]
MSENPQMFLDAAGRVGATDLIAWLHDRGARTPAETDRSGL